MDHFIEKKDQTTLLMMSEWNNLPEKTRTRLNIALRKIVREEIQPAYEQRYLGTTFKPPKRAPPTRKTTKKSLRTRR